MLRNTQVLVAALMWTLVPFAAINLSSRARGDPAPAPIIISYQWPVAGEPTVIRPFEPPPNPYAAGHRGVDLAVNVGETVLAAGDGVVSFAGHVAGRGVVTVTHPDGLRTSYEPLVITVAQGQKVLAGTSIGMISHGGDHCAVSCLHWGVRRGEEYLDPLTLLEAGRVRLLPLA